jgi:hypothetical protein
MIKPVLIFLLTTNSLLLACPPQRELNLQRQIEYDNSELVFIGEIIELTNSKSKFKVVAKEIFKGDIFENCELIGRVGFVAEPIIRNTGLWLIYGTIQEGELVLNVCGLSRDLERPYESQYFNHPIVPPPPDAWPPIDEWERQKEEWAKQQKINSFNELEIELKLLRSRNK